MANKRIRMDGPDTVAGVQRRIGRIRREREEAQHAAFNDLILDTLAGIADAGKEGCRAPDDPVEVAREVLRFGAELYNDPESWLTFESATPTDLV